MTFMPTQLRTQLSETPSFEPSMVVTRLSISAA